MLAFGNQEKNSSRSGSVQPVFRFRSDSAYSICSSCESAWLISGIDLAAALRVRPLSLADELAVDVGERVSGAEYLATTSTLNLEVGRTPGAELPGAVERALLLVAGEAGSAAVVATMPR